MAALLVPGAALAQGSCDALCHYTTEVMKEGPRCFAALRGAPRPGTRPREYAVQRPLEGADCALIGNFINCRLGEYKKKADAERRHAQALASMKAALEDGWTYREQKDKAQRQTIATQGATQLSVAVELIDFSEMQGPIEVGVTFDARECALSGPCAKSCP
jgi:hypothetical protein